jgi:hypothetical protein
MGKSLRENHAQIRYCGNRQATTAMSLILELPKDVESALAFQAQAAHLSPEEYLAKLIERAVEGRRLRAAEQLRQHLDEMAESIAPQTTPEQMEAALEEGLAAVRPQRTW